LPHLVRRISAGREQEELSAGLVNEWLMTKDNSNLSQAKASPNPYSETGAKYEVLDFHFGGRFFYPGFQIRRLNLLTRFISQMPFLQCCAAATIATCVVE